MQSSSKPTTITAKIFRKGRAVKAIEKGADNSSPNTLLNYSINFSIYFWSGFEDLNLGSLAPKASALPD